MLVKKCCEKKIIGSKIFILKNFRSRKFLRQNVLKIFVKKYFRIKQKFRSKEFGSQKLLGQKKFWSKNTIIQNVGQKNFKSKMKDGTKDIFDK